MSETKSIDDIIKSLTLEEKARLVIGQSPFRTEAIPEKGIPAMFMLDSCNGLNSMEFLSEVVYQKLKAASETEGGKPIDRESFGIMGGFMIAFAEMQKLGAAQAKSGKAPQPKDHICFPSGNCDGFHLESGHPGEMRAGPGQGNGQLRGGYDPRPEREYSQGSFVRTPG